MNRKTVDSWLFYVMIGCNMILGVFFAVTAAWYLIGFVGGS